jgi:ZIP family zinc transporter
MLEALAYGAIATSSLLLGAIAGQRLTVSDRIVGLLMGLGAGALIAGLSFELADEAIDQGGFAPLAIGLAAGALAFYTGDRILDSRSQADRRPHGAQTDSTGAVLALGALLDGVPEQAAIGIGLATSEASGGASVALVAAVFLSNVPEAVASSTAMRAAGRATGDVLRLWVGVTLAGIAATLVGREALDSASGEVTAVILAIAAGAVLVMLVDAFIPQAVRKGGKEVGLVTCLGFALAVLLDQL